MFSISHGKYLELLLELGRLGDLGACYREMAEQGHIRYDRSQVLALKILQDLSNELSTNASEKKPSIVTRLTPDKLNEAKRFVTLIDTLYEHRVKLICTAEVSPEQLYPTGKGAFEFERTVSRLHEMQTERYWRIAHQSD
ncbi:MAG: AFG1/ZapE family ATPase [Methylococcales bacterium]